MHPPLADPTQPYVSLPTLKGWLAARGVDVTVVDLNLEAAHWLLREDTLSALAERVGRRFLALDGQPSLDFEGQREWLALHDARRAAGQLLACDPPPVAVFQSPERFYEPVAYSHARLRVDAAFTALSAAYYPYRYGFNVVAHALLPWSFDALARYATGEHSPFSKLYATWARRLAEDVRLVGLSVVFPSQLPEALALAHAVRRHRPRALLVLGGPAIHQIVTHLPEALKRRLLTEHADGIGLYEGEATVQALAQRAEAWTAAQDAPARHALLSEVPNLLSCAPDGALVMGPRFTLDLRDVPAPDFSDLDLDRYWAPSRTLLYAPTRGCYWGRCSFCYYGLADTTTASYREVPPERAAEQLEALQATTGAQHVYLSCDVLSPRYAVRLAQALLDRGVTLTWSSDLKIERYYTAERARLLARAGLRAAAFGIESGSDRILALIDKGTDRATMTEVNRLFHEAGIATEWMTFTDHPGESADEALDTVSWIAEQRALVDLFIVGKFGLESGSLIAQSPERFGIEQVYYASGDELRLYALFRPAGGPRTADDEARVEQAIAEVGRAFALHPYPWAGANSTHHTLLHFVRFGQDAFKTHFQLAGALARELPRAPRSAVEGLRHTPRYDVATVRSQVEEFLAGYLVSALYTTLPGRRLGKDDTAFAPLSESDYAKAIATVPALEPRSLRGSRTRGPRR